MDALDASANKSGAATVPGRRKTRPERRRRWVAGTALTVTLSFALMAGYLDGYGEPDHAQPAQAIVVLGAQVTPQGVPGPALHRRTLHAVRLYQRGLAPRIICTGGVGTNPPAEAAAAAQLAQQNGVPVANLILEDQSTSTWENAANAARICKAHGWTRVILVSDRYHMWRARRDFGRVGLTVYPSPAPSAGWWPRMVGTSREVVVVMRDIIVGPREA